MFGSSTPAPGSDRAEPASPFDTGTELGRAYAAVDWATTPLGPISTWSPTLRSTVRTMMGTRFATWMGWGPELAFFCNDAYKRDTLGSKFPWALGRPAGEVWSEVWDAVSAQVAAVLERGESTWDEALLLFLERSGYVEETYHTFSYSPLTEDDGSIVGLFCIVSEDTGRVVSERRINTLRALAADLAKAQTEPQVYAAVSRQLEADPYNIPYAVGYLVDETGTAARRTWVAGIAADHAAAPVLVDLTRAGEPWTGAGAPQAAGRRVPLTGFADLPTGAWPDPPDHAAILPLRQPGRDVPEGFVLAALNRHRPYDAEYSGFLDLVTDQVEAALTRVRAFEAERLRADQMAELDRDKTTFFTNVSHELRTPLTLLLGPAEEALADDAVGGRERGRLEVIHRNAERLLKLVNTLLDFSRLEAGRTRANFEATDLGALTRELASMFESAFHSAGLTLEIDAPATRQAFHVDREMWAKIVLNLLSNALKATFEGGVVVRLTESANTAVLTVTDSGVGIPAAELDRLFERFHRVSGARLRSHEGSGIGLALVAELAGVHGGTARVSSEPGVGTSFAVEIRAGTEHLPVDQLVVEPTDPARSADVLGSAYVNEALRWLDVAERPPEVEVAPGSATVLVVDDNADMRDYVSGLLAGQYHVRLAADGADALELARTDPPDLVLTDVMMPRLDGFGLLAALRADPATMHIPVVMLSARSGDDAAVEGLESGADDYLVKPFAARELLARVAANLELDRVRRVLAELERSRELLAQAEGRARIGSFDYDLDRDSLVGSVQYHVLLGTTPAQLSERGFTAVLGLVHPDDVARVEQAATRTFADGSPLDVEFRLADGDRVLWASGSVERDDAGRVVRVRGSIQDVTDRRLAEQASAAAAASREAEAREHAIATELQRSLLPATSFEADHLDVAAFYRAGVEGTSVGGDWYDVIDLDAGRTALVLGDVMGRGVRAAAVMGQLRATVRAYARLDVAPDLLLHLLDAAVREISRDTIVTCVYAIYDPADRTLIYANAGHLPPLLTHAGRTRRLLAGGPPLGTGRTWAEPETITLDPGTLLTLYTDGLVEDRDSDLDEGIEALVELLTDATVAGADLDGVPDRLVAALRPEGPEDDIAVLLARVATGSGADLAASRTWTDGPDVPRQARDFATEHLRGWDVPEHQVFDVQLVVSELVTNALRHGRPPVTLRLRRTLDRLYIDVHDNAVAAPRMRHSGPADDGGRGLLIVATLAERWGTRHSETGKSVWCLIRLA